MTSHDTLVLVAELAVAVAGFSGVIVAVENRSVASWPDLQRFNLRVLLQVSALAIFFSIFPLILERVIPQPASWRWALWVYGIVHLVDVASFMLRSPAGVGALHSFLQRVGLLVALSSLLVAGLGSLLFAEVFYLGALVWHLGVAAMGFALLLFDDRAESAG
jgi:hypothetical protein